MKIFAIVIGLAFLLVLAIVGMSYVSASNTGNTYEQAIVGTYQNNENILAEYGQKIQEALGVTKFQTAALKDVFTGAIQARYGKDGSQATMQWIQEQNPNLDQSTFKRIEDMIEAGRNQFQDNQTRLVDQKQAYRTYLGNFWSGMFARMAGRPTIAIGYPIGSKDDYPVISTGRAKAAFQSGVETGNVVNPTP